MADINKKLQNLQGKHNSELDQIRVYLEASVNRRISEFKLYDNVYLKGIKLGEGVRNHVFVQKGEGQTFNFFLGNFDLRDIKSTNEISDAGDKGNETEFNGLNRTGKNQKTIQYDMYFGQANLMQTWEIDRDELKSCDFIINPIKNKDTAFKYSISSSHNKISTLKQITFTIKEPNRCYECGTEGTAKNPLVFCQNDGDFFCSECDANWHGQKDKQSLSLHFRTTKFKYSLIYFGNCPCPGHLNKPYQYFDEANKMCLCVKCVEGLSSIENIAYIEDYLKEKETREDFLNSKIDAACEEIKERLSYAEYIWSQIDKFEKEYCSQLEKKRSKGINDMCEEGYARQTFLCCLFMEIQRIIKEIDSKVIFNKNQRNNVDVSTFLYMNIIFTEYMKEELSKNLDNLLGTNLDSFNKPIISLNENQDFPPLQFEPFRQNLDDDYMMNDNEI